MSRKQITQVYSPRFHTDVILFIRLLLLSVLSNTSESTGSNVSHVITESGPMFYLWDYEQRLHYSALVALLIAAAVLRVSPGAASVWVSSSWGCGRGAPGNASASGSRGQKTLQVRTEGTARLTGLTRILMCSVSQSFQPVLQHMLLSGINDNNVQMLQLSFLISAAVRALWVHVSLFGCTWATWC